MNFGANYPADSRWGPAPNSFGPNQPAVPQSTSTSEGANYRPGANSPNSSKNSHGHNPASAPQTQINPEFFSKLGQDVKDIGRMTSELTKNDIGRQQTLEKNTARLIEIAERQSRDWATLAILNNNMNSLMSITAQQHLLIIELKEAMPKSPTTEQTQKTSQNGHTGQQFPPNFMMQN